MLIVVWSSIVVSLVLGALLCMVDMGYFPFMDKYKIQKNKKVPVDPEERVIKYMMCNMYES